MTKALLRHDYQAKPTMFLAPEVAEVAVTALAPLIEADLRERIARDIEAYFPDPHDEGENCYDCMIIRAAANIARGSRD